jgi:uncharacterized membrane protein YfcA
MGFLQVMISLSCVLRMLFYRKAGLLAGIGWSQALLLVVPVSATILLGHWALQRIHPPQLRKGIFVFIGLSGAYYLLLH